MTHAQLKELMLTSAALVATAKLSGTKINPVRLEKAIVRSWRIQSSQIYLDWQKVIWHDVQEPARTEIVTTHIEELVDRAIGFYQA